MWRMEIAALISAEASAQMVLQTCPCLTGKDEPDEAAVAIAVATAELVPSIAAMVVTTVVGTEDFVREANKLLLVQITASYEQLVFARGC